MMEFNNESKVTPQIVKMTTSVDQTLNEIQVVFSEIVDELVASKFDHIDVEQKLDHRPATGVEREKSTVRGSSPTKRTTGSAKRTSPGLARPVSGGEVKKLAKSRPSSRAPSPVKEARLEKTASDANAVEKERPSSAKIKSLERELKEKKELIVHLQGLLSSGGERQEANQEKEKTTVDKGVEANESKAEASDLYLLSQKQYPVADELQVLKENYNDLEKQYTYETDMYQRKILYAATFFVHLNLF